MPLDLVHCGARRPPAPKKRGVWNQGGSHNFLPLLDTQAMLRFPPWKFLVQLARIRLTVIFPCHAHIVAGRYKNHSVIMLFMLLTTDVRWINLKKIRWNKANGHRDLVEIMPWGDCGGKKRRTGVISQREKICNVFDAKFRCNAPGFISQGARAVVLCLYIMHAPIPIISQCAVVLIFCSPCFWFALLLGFLVSEAFGSWFSCLLGLLISGCPAELFSEFF